MCVNLVRGSGLAAGEVIACVDSESTSKKSTRPTVPAPNWSLGRPFRGRWGEDHYVPIGLADSNGDPRKAGEQVMMKFTFQFVGCWLVTPMLLAGSF